MNQLNDISLIVSRIDHQFNLPPDISLSLDKYYILHWKGSYLLGQLNQLTTYTEDIIIHQETLYRVKLIAPLTSWYLVNHPEEQYKLSFRKLPKKPTGFVLVKSILKVSK